MDESLIDRADTARRLSEALGRAPAVLLTGLRQVGKTTLARQLVDTDKAHYFDLEDPRDLARLADPMLALSATTGTVVIDEAQRMPELFPALRVLIDSDRRPGRFLLLGSASPQLVGLGSESLAGRVALVEMPPLSLSDVGAASLDPLWLRGGLPPAFAASSDAAAFAWLDDYVATFLERDLAQLGVRVPATTMRRFWTMLAHRHSGLWNGADMARSLGSSEPTARRYLDALTDALAVRQLQPWTANIGKRQVRSPKVYLRDSGLLHALLSVRDLADLLAHPIVGASWEGMVVEHVATWGAPVYFWRTQAGAEIDIVTQVGSELWGIEVKRTDSPRVTPSMRHAKEDLGLGRILVVHAGDLSFPLAEGIDAISARALLASSAPPA